MTRTIQIYGLPRTSTNFLEYLVRENTNLYQPYSERYSDYVGKVTAEKHCVPKDETNYKLLVIKSWHNFKKSYKKWDHKKSDADIEKMYRQSIEDYYQFVINDHKYTEVVFYEDLLGNEEDFFEYLGNNWQLTIKVPFDVPKKKMWKNKGLELMKENFDKNSVIMVEDFNPLGIKTLDLLKIIAW